VLVAVTCSKGRSFHAVTSLPNTLAQCDRLVVVDFGCPDHSGALVAEEARKLRASDRVHVVMVSREDAPRWHASRARNVGGRAAAERYPGARLVFVDADVRVQQGFGDWAREMPTGSFGVAGRTVGGDVRDLCGLLVVDAEPWLATGGYLEAIEAYGSEDIEMRDRLWHSGLDCARIPLPCLAHIPHPDRPRTQFHVVRDLRQAVRVSQQQMMAGREALGWRPQRAGMFPANYVRFRAPRT
jgi:hypothetical protein